MNDTKPTLKKKRYIKIEAEWRDDRRHQGLRRASCGCESLGNQRRHVEGYLSGCAAEWAWGKPLSVTCENCPRVRGNELKQKHKLERQKYLLRRKPLRSSDVSNTFKHIQTLQNHIQINTNHIKNNPYIKNIAFMWKISCDK